MALLFAPLLQTGCTIRPQCLRRQPLLLQWPLPPPRTQVAMAVVAAAAMSRLQHLRGCRGRRTQQQHSAAHRHTRHAALAAASPHPAGARPPPRNGGTTTPCFSTATAEPTRRRRYRCGKASGSRALRSFTPFTTPPRSRRRSTSSHSGWARKRRCSFVCSRSTVFPTP
jgi:hypothetical protein